MMKEKPTAPGDLRFRDDTLSVDLWYPRSKNDPDSPRSFDNPVAVIVGLVDVRAADDIRIEYDFERDGWSIRQASVFEWPIGDTVCDPDWQEVAFVQAWGRQKNAADTEQVGNAPGPLVIVDIPIGPRAWFSVDWTIAADKWIAMAPGRTLEMWCNLPHELRNEFASSECAIRRARGVADPDESTPSWALKALPAIGPLDWTNPKPSGFGLAMPITDPGTSRYDADPVESEE
ncbi:MAG TPA: hypothetical protein VER11_34640 [Polyangiaceae bacterium]|nr:hypothetical protein [Polyangiaceae bacterium]